MNDANTFLTVMWWAMAWLFVSFLVALWLGPLLKRARIEQTRPVPGTGMQRPSPETTPRSPATKRPRREVFDQDMSVR